MKKDKNPHAQQLGRLGGLARAKALTDDQRKSASLHAVEAKQKKAKVRRLLGEDPTWEDS